MCFVLLKRVEKYLDKSTFCFTYGDGLANLSINKLVEHHKIRNKLATITAVQPPGRYGALNIKNDFDVVGFQEKPAGDGGWINGGFFVLEPEAIDMIAGDNTIWEEEPLKILSKENELNAFFHNGFWRPMDTLRDKKNLEEN